MSARHFLDLASQGAPALRAILDRAHAFKAEGRRRRDDLAGKTLAMLFEHPSTRTRFSFDVAMRELGGDTIVAAGNEMQLGRGETIGDTARVLSRYVDAAMLRTVDHATLEAFAAEASVPVINGLTNRSHPCQILADLMTVEERRGPIAGRQIAWVGDGNNVAATFVEAATLFGYTLRLASPKALAIPEEMVVAACAKGADIVVADDPREAVAGAEVVVTDTWVSMGDSDAERRRALLSAYRVDSELMRLAESGAIFLHCLPAHRGDEVTDAVMDGPQSAVFDEAENRIHAQKAILAHVFGLI